MKLYCYFYSSTRSEYFMYLWSQHVAKCERALICTLHVHAHLCTHRCVFYNKGVVAQCVNLSLSLSFCVCVCVSL